MHKKNLTILGILIAFSVLFALLSAIFKFSPFIFQLVFNKEIEVKKTDGNINLLLLGIGGGTHDGPSLTDTIIFASINPDKNKAYLVSVPRDLWVPELKEKINTIYAEGEAKKAGQGLVMTKAVLGKILNQKIDYGIRIDFDGFIKAVDSMGGLDIDVESILEDNEYPIEGKEKDTCGHTEEELIVLASASSQLKAFPCRYTDVYFDTGFTHMDGKTALTYVRSRHAEGEEGTDFARSKRQIKVISAFKDKIFSLQTLLNPAKVISIYNATADSIDTDVPKDEFDDFIRLARRMEKVTIKNSVLDYGDETEKRPGLLVTPSVSAEYLNQWVLIPRNGNGDFSEIQKYVDCEIKIGNCPIE